MFSLNSIFYAFRALLLWNVNCESETKKKTNKRENTWPIYNQNKNEFSIETIDFDQEQKKKTERKKVQKITNKTVIRPKLQCISHESICHFGANFYQYK